MPDRIVREGILDSDRVNNLSAGAELFYRRLMSKADDFGRYNGHPKVLLAHCYPLQVDRYSVADVKRWLTECEREDLIFTYEVDGKPYLEIRNFGQRLRQKKQKWPPPPRTCVDDKQLRLIPDSNMLSIDSPEIESESESEVTTTTTKSAFAMGNEQNTPDATVERKPPADYPRPGKKPVEMLSPSQPLLALVDEVLRDFAESVLGTPPTTVVRQIAVVLMRACPGDPEGQFRTLMQAKYDGGYQPRSWRWFVTVLKNAVRDGEVA